MEFVVGTYEELILGYKLIEDDDGYSLETSFTDHSHTGCVKTLAVSKRGILASGSSDETIKLLNLRKRREIGTLMHHKGSITALKFHAKTHMFSTSEDGTVGIWQVGKWECLKTLKGHKGTVCSVAVHPSGKLALSAGKDKTLRTWNLMTAKNAYVTNIKEVADVVLWSPDATVYVVVADRKLDIYSVETAAVIHTIHNSFRVSSVAFVQEDTLVVGGEGGKVHLHNLDTKHLVYEFDTKTNRIKGLTCCPCVDDPNITQLATASSDGWLKVWRLSHNKDGWSSELQAEVDTKFRLICLAVLPERQQSAPKNRSKEIKEDKLKDEEDISDEEEADLEEADSDEEEVESDEEEVNESEDDEVLSGVEDEEESSDEELEECQVPEPKVKSGKKTTSWTEKTQTKRRGSSSVKESDRKKKRK
ncbi:p21-activated protein kinase-interacting protein 1-like [Lamellibrachia satsuma]|nr:p21-activated protein kinase-interacting protein 1-like [Lamellibrachia satsuma]